MIVSKKIKLYFLLILASMGTVAQAGISSLIREKVERGSRYVWDFLPTKNIYVKSGILSVALIALSEAWLSGRLKAQDRSKEEKELADETFKNTHKVAKEIDLSAALVVPAIGLEAYRDAMNKDNYAKAVFASNQRDSGVLIDGRFTPAQQQEIASIISAVGLQKSNKLGVGPVEGGMNSSGAGGTSQASLIGIGIEFDPHNQEHRFVLGHEAIHVKNDHAKKRILAACLIPVAVHAGCALLHYGTSKIVNRIKRAYKLQKGTWGYSLCSWIKYGTKTFSESWILKGLLSFYLLKKYHCMQEKEADLESVQLLKTAQGGIDHFKNSQSNNLKNGHLMSIDNQGNYLSDLEHPSLTERIAYLTPLAEQQAQAVK